MICVLFLHFESFIVTLFFFVGFPLANEENLLHVKYNGFCFLCVPILIKMQFVSRFCAVVVSAQTAFRIYCLFASSCDLVNCHLRPSVVMLQFKSALITVQSSRM